MLLTEIKMYKLIIYIKIVGQLRNVIFVKFTVLMVDF